MVNIRCFGEKMNNLISVVIHTYNNEAIIRECLESVKDFDEIIICDMYSTDKTLEIAAEYNCKVVMHENIGWADPARNFAISQASNGWVLVVDSDEKITKDLREFLYEFIKDSKEYSAVRIPRFNCCWGKALEMMYPDAIIRFFKKDSVFWPPYVHGTPEIKYGQTYLIDASQRQMAIIHNYTDCYASVINTLNKYTDFEVEKLVKKNAKLNFPAVLWKSFWLIIEKYIIKKGYKDGIRGIIFCVTAGFYKFVSYVKYFEYLNKMEKD